MVVPIRRRRGRRPRDCGHDYRGCRGSHAVSKGASRELQRRPASKAKLKHHPTLHISSSRPVSVMKRYIRLRHDSSSSENIYGGCLAYDVGGIQAKTVVHENDYCLVSPPRVQRQRIQVPVAWTDIGSILAARRSAPRLGTEIHTNDVLTPRAHRAIRSHGGHSENVGRSTVLSSGCICRNQGSANQ